MKQKINLKQRGPMKLKAVYLKRFRKPVVRMIKKKKRENTHQYHK